MKRNFSRILFSLLAFALIFSTFSFGAMANGGKKSNVQVTELKLAEIFGDIELSSSRPTTVIVELKAPSMVEAKQKGVKQTKASLKSEREKVIKSLQGSVKSAKVNRQYDHVFSGFSVELPGNEIIKLLATPGVKAVYPNVHYTADVIS
ncbi:MAG: protease inhibitor I9 family protein, partial [Bacillaceae bacterium]|nr:protease inhibitor I9 family protein [Bacillaceae bacterium]